MNFMLLSKDMIPIPANVILWVICLFVSIIAACGVAIYIKINKK